MTNIVVLIGNLTKDPEVRYTDTGTAVCAFTIAVNRGKDQNGNDMGADFPRIRVFNKIAENCEKYLAKGKKVAVTGKINTGSYQKSDGTTVYTTDVIANNVDFLTPSDHQGQNQGYNQGYNQNQVNNYSQPYNPYVQDNQQMSMNSAPPGFDSISDDDIPF